MFDITENTKLVNVSPPIDGATGSIGLATEWIAMKYAEKATFMLSIGVNSASASALLLSLSVANNASGTKSATIASASTDLGLAHVHRQAGDTYTKTTVSSSVYDCSKSSHDNEIVVVEVNAAELGQFVSTSVAYDADYVRLTVTDPVGSALISCSCLLTGYRYQQSAPPSSIT